MAKFIELTYMKRIAGELKSAKALVHIDSVAILNDLSTADDYEGAAAEVRIAGGGTLKCQESYDAVKFLLGLSDG